MTDWAATASEALDAAEKVLAVSWERVAGPATAQIEAIAKIAAKMELEYAADPASLSPDDYQSLRSVEMNALKGIFSAYQGIGILAAEQAADAAWAVFATALKMSIPFA